MSHQAGIWIDHKKAVIVTISAGHVSTKTLVSGVGPHTHYAGSQEGGGEKKYEERHTRTLTGTTTTLSVSLTSQTLF